MRIVQFHEDELGRIPFLNAGRKPNQFYTDYAPVYHGIVDSIPKGLDALVLTADLQGRESFANRKKLNQPTMRLLGEVMPELLLPYLESLGIDSSHESGAILAGDFYTYPDLRGRGGTGNVSSVWQAFSDQFKWVVGVAGNHDTFAEPQPDARKRKDWNRYKQQQKQPRDHSLKKIRQNLPSQSNAHFLDGNRTELDGLEFAGLSGVIGHPSKSFRRNQLDFLETLELILMESTDIAVMHDGPSAPLPHCKGIPGALDIVNRQKPSIVVRGHCHWPVPFVELESGVQIVNVDATVVILTGS